MNFMLLGWKSFATSRVCENNCVLICSVGGFWIWLYSTPTKGIACQYESLARLLSMILIQILEYRRARKDYLLTKRGLSISMRDSFRRSIEFEFLEQRNPTSSSWRHKLFHYAHNDESSLLSFKQNFIVLDYRTKAQLPTANRRVIIH
jgi:hypothetical protein